MSTPLLIGVLGALTSGTFPAVIIVPGIKAGDIVRGALDGNAIGDGTTSGFETSANFAPVAPADGLLAQLSAVEGFSSHASLVFLIERG